MTHAAATPPTWSVVPSGDRCLAVAFDGELEQANWRAHTAAQRLRDAQIAGVVEIVPGMVAVSVHYAPLRVGAKDEIPFAVLARQVETVLRDIVWGTRGSPREVTLPVCYGGEYGPDLAFVAETCGLTTDEVVRLHSGKQLDVFMLGFAPGHPYMGTLDERLSIGRRTTPRTVVPRGSVAIANRQSNVYPAQLPGGWHLIGRTPFAMFDPKREPPCLLDAGDRVRFVPIEPREFEAMQKALTHR